MKIFIGIIVAILLGIGITLVNYGMAIAGAIQSAIIVSYILLSLGIIRADEVGMEAFLGKPKRSLSKGHGLYLAWWGFYKVHKESGKVFQDELPADPEHIYRGDDMPPAGKFPPIRIPFGPPDPKETDPKVKDSPYNIQMVTEVVPVVAWKIIEAITFFTFFGIENGVAECRKMLADKAVETFAEDLTKITPAKAMTTLGTIGTKMKSELKTETASWGIEVEDGYVKPFIFSHTLNDAVQRVSIAAQDAKAVEMTAGGERARLLKTGLAKENTNGTITLVPDAATKAHTDAIAELKNLKGTLVLGDSAKTVLDVNKGGNQK